MTYHYIESGLDNVYLENGYTVHRTPYGEGVSIQDTQQLHAAIARWLVERPRPFNGAELRFLRLELNMTQKSLAAAINDAEQNVRRWEKARTELLPNGPADLLVRVIYADYRAGDGQLKAIIDRLAQLDRVEYAEARFRETSAGWKLAA